ncbi:MAG: carbohydrate-binding family 9-like protein [Pyrinomonadaceae bacterium]|nr:carbohydrate-binding family 9-like protein [Pyrinomonadaceae bacterium]
MPQRINIKHINNDFSIEELDSKSWNSAREIEISTYWNGTKAPKERWFETQLLWSQTALYVRFETETKEPLVVSDAPNLETKTIGLWDRDVCEIFLAPNREEFRKYFEFEIAPIGEWLDLAIHQKPDERITDWDFNSGMTSAAKIRKDEVVMAFTVEWKAFGVETPKAGDIWLGNILRAMGSEPNRSYLAWAPSMTEQPNFHVPEKFGEFVFEK